MKTYDFGSMFEFIRNGMSVKQSKMVEGLPVTRIETISNSTIDGSRVGYAGLLQGECSKWLLEPGDILFSHINSPEHIGKCAVYRGIPEKLIHGMNLLCMRCDRNVIEPEFAKYLIRGPEFRNQLGSFTNKAVNQASVSIGNVKTIRVTLPPLIDQKRIAAILDKADAIRRKRQEAIRLTDDFLRSVFLDMFGDQKSEMSSVRKLLDSGHLLLHKDGNHGSQYPRSNEFGDEGIAFLSANCIDGQGSIMSSKAKYLEESKARSLKIGWIEAGDVLLAHNATVGPVAIYDGQFGRCLIGTSLTAFRPAAHAFTSEFLAAALRADDFQFQLEKSMSQTTRNQVPITAQRDFVLPTPPIEKQRQYSSICKRAGEIQNLQRESSGEADETFASLQKRTFLGEL